MQTQVAQLPNFLVDLLRRLDTHNIKYVIGGSFASSAWGQPRQTHDIDIAVLTVATQAKLFAEDVQGDFLLSFDEIENAFTNRGPFPSFQLLHMDELFKVDMFVLENDEYSAELMRRRREYPIAEGQ